MIINASSGKIISNKMKPAKMSDRIETAEIPYSNKQPGNFNSIQSNDTEFINIQSHNKMGNIYIK